MRFYSLYELSQVVNSILQQLNILKHKPTLPSQTGNAGKALITNGTSVTWATPTASGGVRDPIPTDGSTNSVESNGVFDALSSKVDIINGKQLSTEDYTTSEKNKLSGIASGATANTGDVTLVGVQTLTNKTLTNPVINTPTGITKSDIGLSNVPNIDFTSQIATNAAATVTNATAIADNARLPLNSRIVWFGDSQTSSGLSSSTNSLSYSSFGYSTFANLYSNYLYYTPIGGNKGVSGNTTSQMIARLGAAVALNPKVVVVLAGTNDVNASIPSQTTVNNLQRIYNSFIAAGTKVVAITILPRFGGSALSAGNETSRQTINTWIRSQSSPDITVIDAESTLNSTFFYDGLHLTSLGASTLGNLTANAIKGFVKTTPKVSDILTSDNSYNTNLYLTGTSGTLGGGATGTVATGYTLDGLSVGASVVGSIVTLNGVTSQQITISGNYTGNSKYITLKMPVAGPYPVIGESIEGLSEYEIVTNNTNVIGVDLNAVVYNFDYSITAASLHSFLPGDQIANPLSTGVRYTDRTPAFTLTAANGADLVVTVILFLKNAASSTPINFVFNVHKMGIRKIPSNL